MPGTMPTWATGAGGRLVVFDASIYHLQYNNRIGTVTQQRATAVFNFGPMGNSAAGIESLVELSPVRAANKNKPLPSAISNFYFVLSYNDALVWQF